jgi:hypothetical protein
MALRGDLLVSEPRRCGRLRAPQQDGAVVAEPALAEVGRLVADNRRRFAEQNTTFLGRSWPELRRLARQTAVASAREYLRRAGEPVPTFDDQSLLMAGHQPELFHPGVWVKNFALHGLARTQGATPINLIVDNDTAKSAALHVPALAPSPHVAQIPFDQWTGEVPYEERAVADEALFGSLSERAAPFFQDWPFTPFLGPFWSEVRGQAERTSLLGERLVAARRTFERHWNCHNLELPVSWLCRTEPFAWFVCHLLTELPRFHATYNASVQDYRKQYGIRSRNHPVPELARQGDWLEAPLWAWRSGQKLRRRLLVRQHKRQLELRAGNETWPALPLDPAEAATQWRELEERGLKVRSRALTNTLFARLFLADLFIHGIGGGKYDELTDEIIRRFYGFEPPGFLVLSATLLLPFPAVSDGADAFRSLLQELRSVRYNPQRHLRPEDLFPAVHDLIEQKQSWIHRVPSEPNGRRERFQVLRALNDRLRPYVQGEAERLAQELARSQQELRTRAVLQRRDYHFCLYPESALRPFCTQFLS